MFIKRIIVQIPSLRSSRACGPTAVVVMTLMILVVPLACVAGAAIDFNREVRPILSSRCFKCHGPDEGARKASLRLDLREQALKPAKSGEIAIVPGKPDASELVRRIFTDDEDDLMPPPSVRLPLTAKEKEILKQWIAEGAEYKPHWAFVKPAHTPLPQVRDSAWPRNAIDYFVLARLEKEGLSHSPRADKYTLVRRLYLDLVGLPPTPEQADQFVNNPSPDAYERLVDMLLASPHYGERWARRWLDLARYADTNGYEKDRPRSMWPWRDWVIKALNEDMPFNKFTIEQLAGDLLPNATQDQITATGFHRNSMINEEGGIDPLEYRFYSMVDRVQVTATTWLGLTLACAQCHTHKFDPIQQTDYYRFMAFLNNADEPMVEVPRPDLAQQRRKIQQEIDSLEAGLIDRFPAEIRVDWLTPGSAQASSENGAEIEMLPDGSFRVGGKNPEKDTYTIAFDAPLPRITHVQVEAIPDEKVATGGPGRTEHGNFVLSEIQMEIEPRTGEGQARAARFSSAEADASQEQFPVENAIDGNRETGWAPGTAANKRFHRRAIFTLSEPLSTEGGAKVKIRLVQNFGKQHTLGRFRVALGNETPDPRPMAERRRAHRDLKFTKWLEGELGSVVTWQRLRPVEATSRTPVLTIEKDDSVFASGDFTKSDTYSLKFRNLPQGVKAIRLEALPDERLPNRGPGTVHYEGPFGDFWLSNLGVSAEGKPVPLKAASESYAKDNNTAAKAIDDDLQSGWSIDGAQGRAQNAVFQLAQPLEAVSEMQVDLTFERYYAAGLGRFRIWTTTEPDAKASPLPNEVYETLLKYRGEGGVQSLLASRDAGEDREKVLRHYLKLAPELASERREIEKLRAELPKYPTTLVLRERSPDHTRATHRHHRGEFLQPKEEVTPGVPAFLPPLPADAPPNRLGLAEWLVSPDNPLTPRVIMNRHWEAFFGRGLVRTTEDFGFQGELPTQPELLDWLALEFIRQDWSQKKMHKLLVMSATYQQASRVTPELLERDPQNLLLARGPRFRVEAELVRDAALAASGLFSEKLGGPSVYPPQPPGVTTEGAYGELKWTVSDGPDRYRRGLYTFAKRTAPYAMTAAFDGPSGEACLARRDRSNTPLQALTLLNDEVFVECARALGKAALLQAGSEEAVADVMFRRCLTRPPSMGEREKLVQFYKTQLARFASGELQAADITGTAEGKQSNEQAAWTAVARVLLNLDESISKN